MQRVSIRNESQKERVFISLFVFASVHPACPKVKDSQPTEKGCAQQLLDGWCGVGLVS